MTTIKEAKRACSIKKWARIIKDCQVSALTQAEYFEKNNISKNSYYYWQRILHLKMLENQDRPSAPSSSTSQFAEVDVTTGKAMRIVSCSAIMALSWKSRNRRLLHSCGRLWTL